MPRFLRAFPATTDSRLISLSASVFENLVWIVPAAVLAVGAASPRAGLLVFAASLPLFGAPPGGPYLAALDVAAIAAIATGWRAGRWRASVLDWPAACLVVVSAASLIPLAYHPPSYQPAILVRLVQFLPDAAPSLPIYSWRALIDVCIGFALFHAVRRAFGSSIVAIGTAVGVGLSVVLALGLATYAGLVTLDGYRAIGGELYESRLHSLFFHSGWLAQYVVLATPFAVAAGLGGGPTARLFGVGVLVLSLVTILFTQQRGAWFAALAQGGVLLAREGGRLLHDQGLRRRVVVIIAIVAVTTGIVVLASPETIAPVVDRLGDSFSNLSGRTSLWRSSLDLLASRPALGWGVGGFAVAYDGLHPRGSPGAWPYRDTAHNLYLNVAVERGIIGLAALALLGSALAYWVWSATSAREPLERTLAMGLFLSGVGFVVIGLVQDTFYIRSIQWLSWILAGSAAALCPSRGGLGVVLSRSLVVVALVLVPWRAIAVAAPESAFDHSFGFHDAEPHASGALRWTTGHAVRRIPWEGEVLVLPLANGHPRAPEHTVEVVVNIDGDERSRRTLERGWEELRFDVGSPQRDSLLFELVVRPTFRPFSDFRRRPGIAESIDFRSLGVAVGDIRWEQRDSPARR